MEKMNRERKEFSDDLGLKTKKKDEKEEDEESEEEEIEEEQ
jgi:hypothetical protein